MSALRPWIVSIKKGIKKFVAYSIEGEDKVYRLKHTPFCIRRNYTRRYHAAYDSARPVPNKIVFDNYMGKGFGCNGKYVTNALLADDREYDIVWTVKNAAQRRTEFPEGVRLVEYGSGEAMREYATAGVWVQNYQLVHYLNQGLLKKPGQTYIQMWHGSFGIKKIENNCDALTRDRNWTVLAERNSGYTDYWISNGSFETEVYQKAFWNVTQVLEYGHPRNDIFFSGEAERIKAEVCRRYHIENQKILLYVPTFRDEGMLWEQRLSWDGIKESLEKRFGGEWNILIRLHPRMREYADRMIPKRPYVTDATEYPDIQELLVSADAVITDYSSAVFDYLLTGRPAFLYAPDYRRYEKMRGLYYPLEDTPFPLAGSQRELEENIVSFDAESYKEKVKAFLQGKGSVEDGGAARRVAELIRGIVERKESEL